MPPRSIQSIILPCLLLSLVSCGGDDPTQPGGDGGGPKNLTISLNATSAMPGEKITIDGIPASVDLEGAYMITRDAGTTKTGVSAEETWLVPLGQDDAGNIYVIAPMRPADPVGGGSIEMQLAGNNLTSNAVPFTVEALPPATTTVADMVDNLQGLMDTWLEVHGTTREELRAMDPKTAPAWMYPLWHAHEILDSPDNPSSMRAAVDGPVPVFDNEVIDFDALDRIVSLSGMNDLLTSDIASIDSLPRVDTLTVPPPSPQQAPRLQPAIPDCNIPAGNYDINTASELDIVMEQSVAAFGRLDASDELSALGVGVSAAGGIPQIKAATTVVSGAMYVYKLLNDAAAKLLPTSFEYQATDFDIADDDVTYNEDDEGGFWLNFRISATSQGWALDQAALKAIFRLARIGGFSLGDVFPKLEESLIKFAITQGTKAMIGEATDGSSLLEVCPGVWNISDGMSSSVFSQAFIISGTSFKMNGHTFFETDGTGISQLEVGTRRGRFGNLPPAKKVKDIEVIAIEVEVTPSSVTMEDSEVQTFDAVVKNASDDKVTWTVPPPLQEVDLQNFGKTIVVQAPAPGTNWDSVVLKARSQANTGSREGRVDSDPRDGFAAINRRDSVTVALDPTYACVQNGDSVTFDAIVEGTNEAVTLLWDVEEGFGTINQSGVYTAPPVGATTDVISVTVVEHPNAAATATVRVGVCNCEYSILTSGLNIAGGDVAYRFTDLPNGFHSYAFFYELQEYGAPEGVGFSIGIAPTDEKEAPQIGETGRWQIGVSYIDASGQPWVTNDSTVTVELTITEHTDTYMKGTFTGFLAKGGDDNFTITVFGSFRAGRWQDGGGWPCE